MPCLNEKVESWSVCTKIRYNIHPTQVKNWKKQLLAEGPTLFDQNTAQQQQEQATRETELYEQIGRLKMELEWLKKKAAQFA